MNKRLDTPTAFAADFDPVASGGGTFIQTFRTGTTPPSRRREKTRSSTRVRSPNFSNAKRRPTSSSSPRRRSKTSRRSRRPSTTRRASVRSIRSTLRCRSFEARRRSRARRSRNLPGENSGRCHFSTQTLFYRIAAYRAIRSRMSGQLLKAASRST